MSTIDIVESIFKFLGGIGIFLFSMKLMSESLESIAGNKLKGMFDKLSKSKLAGVGIGAASTALIQSSGAVTVMVIGFINAGLMDLTQAATIIYGSNIGTTITAQIVALGMLGGGDMIDVSAVLGALAGIGALIMIFTDNDKVKRVSTLLVAFGMLFVGLMWMSSAMSFFAESQALVDFLSAPALENVVLLALVGVLITVVLQSSSAVTGIVITMLASGLLSINQGIYIALGSNIGTCAVALMASIGSVPNAKRAALIHLIFNVFGVVVFMLIGIGVDWGAVMEKLFPGVPETQLAMMHTMFNVATVILILPFTNLLVKFTQKLIKDKPLPEDADKPRFRFIEEHLLGTPAIAVAQVKNEVLDMSTVAMNNFNTAMTAIITGKTDSRPAFDNNEKRLNFLNREMPIYLVKLSSLELLDNDARFVGTVYHTVIDLERIGDYSKNLMEYAEQLRDGKLSFSDDAVAEIERMRDTVNSVCAAVTSVYADSKVEEIAVANAREEEVDGLKESMIANHIDRLNKGVCSVETGSLYYAISSDCERVSDHLINISNSVKSFLTPKQLAPKE